MTSSQTWAEWFAKVPTLSEAAAALAEMTGQSVTFKLPHGTAFTVYQEQQLPHLHGTCWRARCSHGQKQEYDLRRLVACPAKSHNGDKHNGFVPFETLSALEHEVGLMLNAGQHPNIVACHASLVENLVGAHTRLLLCDPCIDSLTGHILARGGSLPTSDIAQIGHHLALGLSHFHTCQIFCGGITPAGVLLGCDGQWKLGDLSRSVRLPVSAEQWRKHCNAQPNRVAKPSTKCTVVAPPETRGSSQVAIIPTADIWLLAHLIANLVVSAWPGSVLLEQRDSVGDTLLALTPEALLETLQAHLWLLLHWMLAFEPSQRPSASETCALFGALEHASAPDLLKIMPAASRFHCSSSALGAIRRLAASRIMALGADAAQCRAQISHAKAGMTLAKLRDNLEDPTEVDLLCANCGVNLDWEPEFGERSFTCPSSVPQLVLDENNISRALGNEMLYNPRLIDDCGRTNSSMDERSTSAESECGHSRHQSVRSFDSEAGDDESVPGNDDPAGEVSPQLVDLGTLLIDWQEEEADLQHEEDKKDR